MTTSPRRNRASGTGKRRVRIRWLKLVVIGALVALVIGAGVGTGFVMGALETMPSIEDFRPNPALTSFIYDRDGGLVTELHGPENRILVTLDQIPEHVQDAFLAIEDARFYQHMGVDVWRILGALYANLTTGTLEGASTITQQLARTAWLHLDQTWERKIQEAFLALQLERRFTKREIFQMYLNQINFGHGAWGIQAAAQIYFNKDVEDLTLAEGALLAAIPKGPSIYSPHRSLENATRRRNLVLTEMAARDMISQQDVDELVQEPLGVVPLRQQDHYDTAAYFVDYVVHQLLEQFTFTYQLEGMSPSEARRAAADFVYAGGLSIYTTLHREAQAMAEAAIAEHLDPVFPMDTGLDFVQAAAVFLDPHTGHISAMVGGRARSGRLEFNRAWQAYRQPGSAFKPVAVYTAAIEAGHTPASVVDDFPVGFRQFDGTVWYPHNYDHKYHGLTTYREAIRRSVNVPAVRVLDSVGISLGYEYAERLGVENLIPSGVLNDVTHSLALGGITKGVTPLELGRSYAPFANGGFRITPISILRVEDQFGSVVIENLPQREVAIERETAYIMTDMLMSVIADSRRGWNDNWGTGWRATLPGWQVAGKTGTTDDNIDAWWVGYTPEHLGVVWLGYDREHRMYDVFGGHYPALIWKDVMTVIHEDVEPVKFEVPRGIIELDIDIKSGLLPSPLTPSNMIRREVFIEGTQPTEVSKAWVTAEISAQHPEYLYDPNCDQCDPESRVFLDRTRVEPYTHPERDETYLPRDMALAVPDEYCTVLHSPGFTPGPIDDEEDDPPLPPDDEDVGPPPPLELELTSLPNEFSPRAFFARPDQHITLTLRAEGHDLLFSLPHLDIEQFVPAGEHVVVELEFTQTGRYDFYCRIRHPDSPRLHGRIQVD